MRVELVSKCWAAVLVNVVLNLAVCLRTVTAPVSELGGNFSSAKTKHHDLSRLLDHWIQQSVTLKAKYLHHILCNLVKTVNNAYYFTLTRKNIKKVIITIIL